ncbi:MAG: glycogen/starch/alpha-glucan family phosphorylase [Acutalibacteraceae bacterium]
MNKPLEERLINYSRDLYGKSMESLDKRELYSVLAAYINEKCDAHKRNDRPGKRVAYFSAEFLIGTLLRSNLYNMNITDLVSLALRDTGHDLDELRDIDDYAFGNGGLGRLAACFLDSAASCDMPLDGYGIRYQYGLFRQSFSKHGEQLEEKDDWARELGDPFAIKKEEESVTVHYADFSVKAVPYDYHIIGYKFKTINTLRLYQSEADGEKNEKAFEISDRLYPDDSTREGKILRLRQEYFFTSAALQNIMDRYAFDSIEDQIKIQLNDTHPVIAIPEFINQAVKRDHGFDEAFNKCKKIFAYTNHTVMPEALEEWDEDIFAEILPQIYGIIKKINDMLIFEASETEEASYEKCKIISRGKIKMANLACYVCSHINGVAKIHSDIIAAVTLNQWYRLYPDKFTNVTNGITQRRWLGLSNPRLTSFLSRLCGCDIVENIEKIERLKAFENDAEVLKQLREIKTENKKDLCEYIRRRENISLDPESVFLVQIKRIHEYKRQLMAAFLCVHLYRMLKNGEGEELPKMTVIFGGKAAPGYKLAKSIIRYINTVAKAINSDPETQEKLKVVFVENYNVSYGEKIIPAADISLQISLAGTEASGTGNMKFMMNGAVTLGTYDGANIEIAERAGEENCYIFGMREKEVEERKGSYDPEKLCRENPLLLELAQSLIDGSFGEKNEFEDIYASLFCGTQADRFMVMADLSSFIDTALLAIKDSRSEEFLKKALVNIASSAFFSSDRSVREYGEKIWFAEKELQS